MTHSDDSQDHAMEQSLQQLLQSGAVTTSAETDLAWAALAERLNTSPVRAIATAPSMHIARARRRAVLTWRGGVAVVAALLTVTAGWQAWQARTRVIEAPRGQRISAMLPDGSSIMLAAGSRASWSRAFGDTNRTITLFGEAWFDVVHDEDRPFRVHAAHVIVEDLGTRFVVRAWSAPRYVEVAVEEGIVSVADSGHSAQGAPQLHAGQRARAVPGQPLVVSTDVAPLLAWTDGALQFDDALLVEAVADIERWYNVTMQVDPALATRRLSARFETQPLSQLLGALAVALDVRVVQTGSGFHLVPK